MIAVLNNPRHRRPKTLGIRYLFSLVILFVLISSTALQARAGVVRCPGYDVRTYNSFDECYSLCPSSRADECFEDEAARTEVFPTRAMTETQNIREEEKSRELAPAKAKEDVAAEIGKKALERKTLNIGQATFGSGETTLSFGIVKKGDKLLTSTAYLASYIGGIARIAVVSVGFVFFALIAYAGYLWMVAGGNEELIKRAKSIIVRASVGLTIVLFAGAIIQFVLFYAGR